MISKKHIATLFLTVGVLGIMLSMIHYHSEGLLCVHHAEEQHYTENELLCPVAGLVAIQTEDTPTDYNFLLQYQQTLINIQELLLSIEFHNSLLGRAPPFVI